MKSVTYRHIALFAALSLALALIFFAPISELLRMAIKDELYSYIPLIPLVSCVLVFRNRESIFSETKYAPILGIVIVAAGGLLFAATREYEASLLRDDFLSGVTTSAILCFIGCFFGVFGAKAFGKAIFPLTFLFLMVPIPTPILDRVVLFLQVGSTETAHVLFKLTGVPVLRDGFTFQLPGLSVEVAKQCSGIRSSVSLAIVSLLMSRFVLRTFGMRALLVLSTIPITLFKNGVRIVTLALLGAYVDQRILESQVHRSGGIPIFGLALVLLFAMAWVLRRVEKRKYKEIHHRDTETQRMITKDFSP